MPRCANKLCRTKLAKGTKPPLVCNDSCRDSAIAQALHKKREADKRAQARARNLVEREAKAERKESRRKKAEYYDKDPAKQLELTQKAVNALATELDRGKPCICCGRADGGPKKRNSSHLKSVGSNSFLRFCLINLHGGCTHCNLYLSGNLVGFREGVVTRYGQATLDYLDTAPRLKKWTPEECKAIRIEANAEVRRLKRGEPASKDWRALPQQQEARLSGREVPQQSEGSKAA